MNNKKTIHRKLPDNVKFAIYNTNNKDIVLSEYLIASSIYNGNSLDQILESANEIEDIKERKIVKDIMTNIFLDFIKLNPEFGKSLKQK